MFNSSKKSFSRFLCAALSLILIVSTFIMPVGAVEPCTNGHKDANSDYLCDVCGMFTGKVTGLKVVSEKSTSVKIKWNKVPGADGYKLYIKPDSEDDFNSEDLGSICVPDDVEFADTQATSMTISPLMPSMNETIVVRAYKKAAGNDITLGDESAPLVIHTVPAKVGGFKKSNVLATKVTLSWSANELNGDVRYNIFQYDSAKKTWKKIKTTKYDNYTVTGLKKNKTYKFRVQAFYKEGKKTYTGNVSKTITVKTGDTQLNLKSTKLAIGAKLNLFVDGTSKKVTWSSSNKKIVTVNSKGVIKGIKAGKATITAKVGKKSYTCKVEVKTPAAFLDWYFKKYSYMEMYSAGGATASSIEFKDGKYVLSFLDTTNNLSTCTVSFKKDAKSAKSQISYLNANEETFEITAFNASGKFTVAKYTGKKNQPSFKFKDLSGVSKGDAKKISNKAMSDAFASWNKLLKKETGLTLKALGFTAYKAK